MSRRTQRSVAIVTIFDAGRMSRRGRASVAAWLRRQARLLSDHASQLATRYTARYLYR